MFASRGRCVDVCEDFPSKYCNKNILRRCIELHRVRVFVNDDETVELSRIVSYIPNTQYHLLEETAEIIIIMQFKKVLSKI